MPVLTDQQRKFYETTLQVTKEEIGDLKDQIEEELAKVKDRIAELQNARQSLARLARECAAGDKGPCPIIASFEGPSH